MKKQSIIDLAKCATNRPNLSVEISYADTGRTYRVLGFIKIKFNGQWYVQVEYISMDDKAQKYSRPSAEFGSFSEVIV